MYETNLSDQYNRMMKLMKKLMKMQRKGMTVKMNSLSSQQMTGTPMKEEVEEDVVLIQDQVGHLDPHPFLKQTNCSKQMSEEDLKEKRILLLRKMMM